MLDFVLIEIMSFSKVRGALLLKNDHLNNNHRLDPQRCLVVLDLFQ
jgi:hypothetical protein